MTLLIRLISPQTTIHFSDGRITVNSVVSSDNATKTFEKDGLILSFAGVTDDDQEDKTFNILRAVELGKVDTKQHPVLVREAVFELLNEEYDKNGKRKLKELTVFLTLEHEGRLINETLFISHLKCNSILNFQPAMIYGSWYPKFYEKEPFAQNYSPEFVEAMMTYDIKSEIKIDFNHRYFKKMPYTLQENIGAILFSAFFEVVGELPNEKNMAELDAATMEIIGILFFEKFTAINTEDRTIGQYQKSVILRL